MTVAGEAPITLSRLERGMDTLCRIMADEEPEYAEKLIPLYRLLETEIEARRASLSTIDAARARARDLKRSSHRTAA